ncbi:MAG TPA: hypothetical protein VMG63_12270 [Terriglobia bacterium]|nr:hypothetical protein [Terriglobia bacterium]
MSEWKFAQVDRSEELAELHFFSIKKRQTGGDVNFRITVKEFAAPPPGQHLRYFAEADKKVNQTTAPIRPCGWGDSVAEALSGCARLIRQFPYEGEDLD